MFICKIGINKMLIHRLHDTQNFSLHEFSKVFNRLATIITGCLNPKSGYCNPSQDRANIDCHPWVTNPNMGCRDPTIWQGPRTTLIARFMGPTWGPPGADRTQVGPMWAMWTLLSGNRPATAVSLFIQNTLINRCMIKNSDVKLKEVY